MKWFAWLSSLVTALSSASCANITSIKDVGPDEFEKMMSDSQAVILDVRTPREHQAGAIKNAKLMDVSSADFDTKAAALDKEKTYLVYCASGVRSVKASRKLAALGFTKLINLQGGYNGWVKKNKPVQKQP